VKLLQNLLAFFRYDDQYDSYKGEDGVFVCGQVSPCQLLIIWLSRARHGKSDRHCVLQCHVICFVFIHLNLVALFARFVQLEPVETVQLSR